MEKHKGKINEALSHGQDSPLPGALPNHPAVVGLTIC